MLVNILLILINSLCVLYKRKTKLANKKLDRNEYKIVKEVQIYNPFLRARNDRKAKQIILFSLNDTDSPGQPFSILHPTPHHTRTLQHHFNGVSLNAIFSGRYQIQLKSNSSSNNNKNNKTKITTYIYTQIVFQIIFKLKIIMCNCQIS